MKILEWMLGLSDRGRCDGQKERGAESGLEVDVSPNVAPLDSSPAFDCANQIRWCFIKIRQALRYRREMFSSGQYRAPSLQFLLPLTHWT